MKIFALIAAAAMAAGPALAQDAVKPAPEKDASGVYQVFRTTDNQLNCEQLTSEMNLLNAQIKKQAEADAKKAKGGGAGARSPERPAWACWPARPATASAQLGGLGYAGAVAASSATDAAASAATQQIVNGQPAPAAPATISNEQQRMNRVAQLFAARSSTTEYSPTCPREHGATPRRGLPLPDDRP